MKQGIDKDASVAAKTLLNVAKERHATAVAELKSVSALKEIEKTVGDQTLQLIATKESLESVQAAHLEVEEQRVSAALAWKQNKLNWEKEMKQAEGEQQHFYDQLLYVNDLKSKLDAASTLLSHLKYEFAAELSRTKRELEEVRTNIKKAKDEVNFVRATASSLKCELERETAALTTLCIYRRTRQLSIKDIGICLEQLSIKDVGLRDGLNEPQANKARMSQEFCPT